MSGPRGEVSEEDSSDAEDPPAREPSEGREQTSELKGWLHWIWRTDRGPVAVAREVVLSVLVVLVIAMLLFAVSGVWPPLVAVESDSMEPRIMTGDLVFIAESDRFADAQAIDGTGVVPADRGMENGYEAFGAPGDVIIFSPNGDQRETPIIHRAHLWVNEGEDWTDRGDPQLLGGADECDELSNCPAPHGGFITHGDNNAFYDQVQDRSEPVKPEWILARAHFRIPWAGHIRLIVSEWISAITPAPAGGG